MPPAGFKRSRALWDHARLFDPSWRNYANAVLYELQPLRLSSSWSLSLSSLPSSRVIQEQVTNYSVNLFVGGQRFVTQTVPWAVTRLGQFFRHRTAWQWKVFAGCVLYYWFVRLVHEWIDAGPVVVIATALVAIFTIGLEDNKEGRQGLSAYSVFNRGFERILGSLDADELLAQHVGGGMAFAGGQRNFRVDPNEEEDDDDDDDGRFRRAGPRRRVAQNRNNNPAVGDVQDDDDDENENNNNNNDNPPRPNQNGGPSRKSGKKARRKTNVEQRREMRRQREAAIAMGFGENGRLPQDDEDIDDDDDDALTPAEIMALQQLMEQEARQQEMQG